jgi:AcrR family transcriptional regulator
MFRNIVFNNNGVERIPSTTNEGEMSNTEHSQRNVRKSANSIAPAPDRRIRRTRQSLHDAFIALIIEKGYENTTIQDILDRADVGRSTFYVHYRDKEALLMTSFDDMRDQLERELTDITVADPIDVALPAALLFQHAHRHKLVYRAVCGHQGGPLVQRYLRRLIGDVLRKSLRPQLSRSSSHVPADVAAEFYTSAALGLLVWWVDQDFCGDHVWLTEHYRKLAAPDSR